MKTALVLAGMLLFSMAPARAAGLNIEGPETVTSDRDQPVVFTLTVPPGPKPSKIADLRVTASAGAVLAVHTTPQGVLQFRFRPPWVATSMTVRIEASARVGKRKLRAARTIQVNPATMKIGTNRSQGPLDMRAPAFLIFDRQESVAISLQKPPGELPRMQVSAGSLSGLKESGDGRLETRFTPPERQFPQVAIIAAQSDSVGLDWIAIPLQAQARVETSTEPGASVDILVGDTLFGPLRADRKGRANMDVLVPPGIPAGTTIATDQLGNTKKASLNLRVPPFRRILGLCPADGNRLRIIAVDAQGRPLQQARLEARASLGELSPPKMIAPGVYEFVHSLPAGSSIGKSFELSAGIRGDKVSRVTCRSRVMGMPPASLKLSVDPPVHQAGGPPLAVSIELADARGQPARTVAVELTTTLGKISEVRSVAPGRLSATWTLPADMQGLKEASIQAAARDDPALTATSSVPLKAGPVARIVLSSSETHLAADGRSTAVITARALDQHGNPVAPVSLSARAQGRIGELTDPDQPGVYQATYTAPDMVEPRADDIVVTESRSRIEASLRMELEKSRSALSVGPRFGYGTNLGRISSPYFALDLGMRLPFFPDLSVGLELGTYWSNDSSRDASGQEQVDTSVWSLPILARAVYGIPIGPVSPYLGFGIGTSIVGREVSSPSASTEGSVKAHFALSGILGADLALGPGRVLAELSYLYILSDETAVRGSAGGLLVSVGYRFGF